MKTQRLLLDRKTTTRSTIAWFGLMIMNASHQKDEGKLATTAYEVGANLTDRY